MSEASALGFPIKGSLKRTPFSTLVRQIADARADGSLYLLSGQTKKVVFFEAGQPAFVRSNVLSECLGQILAREGLITDEQCEQTLEAIRRTGKKQGELLVEMGILSEGNLRYGLEAQLRHKLFDIFGWEEGRYQFKAGEPAQEFGLRVQTGAQGIIVEAILETHSDARARAALQPFFRHYPYLDGTAVDDFDLVAGERHFMACLDGSRTVEEVLADPQTSAPTPATLLYALTQAGLANLGARARPAVPRPSPPADPDRDRPDDEFQPGHAPTNEVKGYEDTPLPGSLPERPTHLPDDDEEMFAAVAEGEGPTSVERDVSEDLLAAESEDVVDETFDDADVELVADDDLELIEDDAEEASDLGAADERPDAHLAGLEPDDDLLFGEGGTEGASEDLLGDDELDGIDLGGLGGGEGEPEGVPAEAAGEEEAHDPEILGAMRFSEGEMALQAGEFGRAVELLEAAYEHGIDVAELHAMLAYARFKTSEMDADMATHALELLEYAAVLNPGLDIVWAYHGAVLSAQGDVAGARKSLQRALDLNPYCDLALELMDQITA